jgi:hypothetical protein
MSIRTLLLALASIAALATTALAPTSAFAYWGGGVRFHPFAGHYHNPFLPPRRSPGLPYIPACGHIGCNLYQ